MTDLISRADAIEIVLTYFIPRSHTGERGEHEEDFVRTIFKALPSAKAEPTVIRSITLLPTKDFKEWAKRIREVNPNAVVIPCDAEVVSAGRLFDAVDVIKKEIQDFEANYMCSEDDENYAHDIGFVAGLHRAKTLIKALPSEMNKEESERSEQ